MHALRRFLPPARTLVYQRKRRHRTKVVLRPLYQGDILMARERGRQMVISDQRDYVKYVTDEEGRKIVDREALRLLDMSGDCFIRDYREGRFDDRLDDPSVRWLAALIPFAE